MPTTAARGHSIYIERQYSADLWVGPYPTTADAEHALAHARLIDGFCQEDCLDARVFDHAHVPANATVVLIDLNDPDHTGAPRPPSADDQANAAALRIMGMPEPSARGCTNPPVTVEALAAAVEPREGTWLVERLQGQVSEIAFSDGQRARTLRIFRQGYPGPVYVPTRSEHGFESSTPFK